MLYFLAIFAWTVLVVVLEVILFIKRWEDRYLYWELLGLCVVAFIGAFLIGSLSAKYG
jgi:uncharacterized membrane protein YhaH (DUF805 family)